MVKTHLLQQPTWRVIDQSIGNPSFQALHSFAIDDTLCTSIGKNLSPPTCRTWLHEKTISLGIQDTKLPYLEAGISYLHQQGYQVIVRNSGGLAVVLDESVLNISLIFPDEKQGLGIDDGYEAMWSLIQDMFRDFNVSIEAKEIVGSYCPGSYDLSIHGKKFAGISQRRIRNGIAVQIYLCVNGSGSQRAETIQAFYQTALKGEKTKQVYPKVQPHTMASLAELLHSPLQIIDVMQRLLKTLQSYEANVVLSSLSVEEMELYPFHLERMTQRNEKFLIEKMI